MEKYKIRQMQEASYATCSAYGKDIIAVGTLNGTILCYDPKKIAPLWCSSLPIYAFRSHETRVQNIYISDNSLIAYRFSLFPALLVHCTFVFTETDLSKPGLSFSLIVHGDSKIKIWKIDSILQFVQSRREYAPKMSELSESPFIFPVDANEPFLCSPLEEVKPQQESESTFSIEGEVAFSLYRQEESKLYISTTAGDFHIISISPMISIEKSMKRERNGYITSFALSGNFLFYGTNNSYIKKFNMLHEKEVKTRHWSHNFAVTSIVIDPKGTWVIAGTYGEKFYIMHNSLLEISEIVTPAPINCILWLEDCFIVGLDDKVIHQYTFGGELIGKYKMVNSRATTSLTKCENGFIATGDQASSEIISNKMFCVTRLQSW